MRTRLRRSPSPGRRLLPTSRWLPSRPRWLATCSSSRVGRTAVDVRQPHSLVVTGRSEARRDDRFHRKAKYASGDEKIARVSRDGWIEPVANGATEIRIDGRRQENRREGQSRDSRQPRQYSFRHDVMPVLSKARCNQGACHGYSLGKNGFKLSLRGADPDADFLALTDEFYERRINRHNPPASLLLTKPLGDVPHKGGVKLERDGVHASPGPRLDRRRCAGRARREPASSNRCSIYPEKIVMRARLEAAVAGRRDVLRRHDARRHPLERLHRQCRADRHGRRERPACTPSNWARRPCRPASNGPSPPAEFIVLTPNESVPADAGADRQPGRPLRHRTSSTR